jgi:tetratricopeptide (TPR) repeat protein
MYNRATFRNCWIWLALTALLAGCAAKPNPFAQQAQQINDISIQGEQWFSKGNLKRATHDFSRALSLSRAVDYPKGAAQQLNNLGAVALEQGDLAKARDLFTQAYNLNYAHQEWVAASVNQANLATVAQKRGNRAAANQHLSLAQSAAQVSQSRPALARVYLQWASYYLDGHDLAAAANFLQWARPLATTPELQATLAHHWGRLALAQGNTGQALEHFQRAWHIDRAILDRASMGSDLFFLAQVHQIQGNLPLAWSYYARAFDVFAGIGQRPRMLQCLEKLREVNLQGQLGHSLKRFEKLTQPRTS